MYVRSKTQEEYSHSSSAHIYIVRVHYRCVQLQCTNIDVIVMMRE